MLHACIICQKALPYYTRYRKGRFCSNTCRGQDAAWRKQISDRAKKRLGSLNSNWRGGRVLGANKRYLMDYAPQHPHPISTAGKTKYILTHRAVMEKVLGRSLTSKEIVHHKNHNPLDNRIENLEVLTRSAHSRLHMIARRKNQPHV